MKNSEITKEARKIMKDVFFALIKCDNKDIWNKAIQAAVSSKVRNQAFAKIAEEKGEDTSVFLHNVLVWGRVTFLLLNAFGKKFVKPKILSHSL
jgi:hypothetical protein